jgi:hypothetical protein
MATTVPVPIPPRFGEHEQAFQTSAVFMEGYELLAAGVYRSAVGIQGLRRVAHPEAGD